MNWWVHQYWEYPGPVWLISWVFWVVLSITLHELAHGWAALWQGDETPRRLGRMNANPLTHIPPMAWLMFAIVGITWGLMPTDPSRYRWRRRGRIVVAGAGPAMNILLAIVSLTLGVLLARYGPQAGDLAANLRTFFLVGGMLNLVLAAFNLLPIPPLDGSSILMGLSLRVWRLYQNPQAQMVGLFIVLAIFISGIGVIIFDAAIATSLWYQNLLSSLLA